MEDAEIRECLAVVDIVPDESWKLAFVLIMMYLIKIVIIQVYAFCRSWLEEHMATFQLKYDLLIVTLENLHLKIDMIQKINEAQSVTLEELKGKSIELRSELEILKMRVAALPSSSIPVAAINTTASGCPPPPPPPPPPFSLLTPAVKIALPSSTKTEMPKKKPTGPPQFSISQADITKVLQKLKKTSSAARLLGSGGPSQRKTPPRRKLFGRTPGLSRRRSITALSPGSDFSRQKTPLSCRSPPEQDIADFNGNGVDPNK